VPAAPESAQLFILWIHRGAALSSAAVGDLDEETTLATIRVEPGSEPLYVIIPASRGMIFKFEGEVSRITAAVLPGSPYTASGSGVIGLDRAKVVFSPRGQCIPDSSRSRTQQEHAQFWEAKFGRKADLITAPEDPAGGPYAPALATVYLVGGPYPPALATVYLPSGKVESGREGRPFRPSRNSERDVWGAFMAQYPRGLVTVDPPTVIAEEPVSAYDVLPSYGGLVQLLRERRLRRIGPRTFSIVRPFPRFPVSVVGSVSGLTYMLDPDAPIPEGDRSGICLVSKATEQPLPGSESKCEVRWGPTVAYAGVHSAGAHSGLHLFSEAPACCWGTLQGTGNGFVGRMEYYTATEMGDPDTLAKET
jgi:hypothetical protein